MLKELYRKSNTLVGLRKGLAQDLERLRYRHLRPRASRISSYLNTAKRPALHIGCNMSRLDGWLETDIIPNAPDVIYLDASERFPLPDACLEFAYSEHVIEHLPHRGGQNMLRECRRTLRDGGVLRISTPDLTFMLGLQTRTDELASEYRKYMSQFIYFDDEPQDPVVIINNVFRAWYHQFLYDEDRLTRDLVNAGFKKVERCAYGESRHRMLRGVEQHGRNVGNEAMARLEVLIVEAS